MQVGYLARQAAARALLQEIAYLARHPCAIKQLKKQRGSITLGNVLMTTIKHQLLLEEAVAEDVAATAVSKRTFANSGITTLQNMVASLLSAI